MGICYVDRHARFEQPTDARDVAIGTRPMQRRAPLTMMLLRAQDPRSARQRCALLECSLELLQVRALAPMAHHLSSAPATPRHTSAPVVSAARAHHRNEPSARIVAWRHDRNRALRFSRCC